ncbi:MAG: tryptophan--tRNA ligase [Bdellovibrionaceae bacterium]|jgi:tryptophanyl-tRNA synthetase|nr:tryptophan--tRNA ligase [Pseudobdellovibrionaceae bacterium]
MDFKENHAVTGDQKNQAPRLMSGMRATGQLHLGHYFGALKNWLQLQHQYPCFFGVMDWHGMTTAYKTPAEVARWARELYAEFVAWGLDPEKNVIFIQSQVPEHLELYMWFSNLTPLGWLERVPTWKDAEEEAKQTDTRNLGRFGYPVLQAADIAVYQGSLVPVGADQVAHLELSREIVRRFNHLYGLRLPEPKPLLTETPLLPGLDGRKMSKSYGNSIMLSEEKESLQKKIRQMPTDPQRVRRHDPGEPEKCTVYSYHKLLSSTDQRQQIEQGCRTAGMGCGDCKAMLLENMDALLAGPRSKKQELLAKPQELNEMIRAGCNRARQEAAKTLSMIKEKVGWQS